MSSGYVYYRQTILRLLTYGVSLVLFCLHILVWASALLDSTGMGNARRLKRGTSDWYSNPHFFLYHVPN